MIHINIYSIYKLQTVLLRKLPYLKSDNIKIILPFGTHVWPLCDIFLFSGQTHVYESKVESSDSTRGFGKHKYSQFTWISSHTLCPFMKKWKVTVSNFINKNFKWRDRVIWIFINTIIHSLGNLNQTQVQTSRTSLIRSWCTKINESIPKKEMLILTIVMLFITFHIMSDSSRFFWWERRLWHQLIVLFWSVCFIEQESPKTHVAPSACFF